MNHTLASLIVHDLILSKEGIAASDSHPLKAVVLRHRTRLNAEFTKLRIKRGYTTLDEFRRDVEIGYNSQHGSDDSTTAKPRKLPHPRWVRVNRLFKDYDFESGLYLDPDNKYVATTSLSRVIQPPRPSPLYVYADHTIPDLYAFSPESSITASRFYRDGAIVFQDKASCFPALLLRDAAFEGDVIDACAAPGNKTTHLAALQRTIETDYLHSSEIELKSEASETTKWELEQSFSNKIFAFERDKARSETLKKMVKLARAEKRVVIKAATDFLDVNPSQYEYRDVTAILLDPSCSGSGMIGRDEIGPSYEPENDSLHPFVSGKSKKRKHWESRLKEEISLDRSVSESRLAGLTAFQLKLILRAMRFPSAVMISYSTCSVHSEENEKVIVRALASEVAKKEGWKLLPRRDQYEGLKRWRIRGDVDACQEALEACGGIEGLNAEDVADACIRCEKHTEDGTMGFFVVGFARPFKEPEREAAFQKTRENVGDFDRVRCDEIEIYVNDDLSDDSSDGEEEEDHIVASAD